MSLDQYALLCPSNDSEFLLPDHDADPKRELQGECSGAHGLPGQQQFLLGSSLPCDIVL